MAKEIISQKVLYLILFLFILEKMTSPHYVIIFKF